MLPSMKFQKGAQIQHGRQTDKTCKFNYFFKKFQDCLNLASCSSSQKEFFLKNSKWPKNSIWQIFCTKIHNFLVAEPLNEMF
jgi:hypothetical protein